MSPADPVRRWLSPVLFIAACFFAADYTAAKIEQNLGFGSAPPSNTTVRTTSAKDSLQNGLANPGELQYVLSNTASHLPAVATVNTTLANGTVVATNTSASATPAIAQGSLPRLTGTLAGGGHSLAVLQSGDETRVSAVGETMNGYTITEVTQFGATLRDAQGVEHRLSLELAQANQMPSPAPGQPHPTPNTLQPAVNATPSLMPAATPAADGSISRSQMQDYMNHYTTWISHMNVRPIKRGDDVVGMQINYNQPDNPMAKLGVSSGDILTNLNGHPLKDPEDLQWAYGELRNATTLNFQLERNGAPVPLNIHLADN